jgi:hypothetical protein
VIEEVQSLVSSLTGSTIVQLLVGPAGIHYDFGAGTSDGEFVVRTTILSNTAVNLTARFGLVILRTNPFPPFAIQPKLRDLLMRRKITRSSFDAAKNAARIHFDEEILLSLVPVAGKQVDWRLSHFPEGLQSRRMDRGFLITAEGIIRITPNASGRSHFL